MAVVELMLMISKSNTAMVQNGWLVKIKKKLLLHSRSLTFIGGSFAISAWAMLRFFVKPSTFDLVGQQLLASQWIKGFHSGATLGPTNYILKILFVYIPFGWLHISPRLGLVLMTLIIDIATYILLVLVLEKIVLQFFKNLNVVFYLSCLWLALMAGSMYWIQFANSRNIEIAGGLLVVSMGFGYIKSSSIYRLIAITTLSSLVLFADPLQLYMTLVPFLLYEFIVTLTPKFNQKSLTKWLGLVVALMLGFGGSKLLTLIAQKIWNVNFIALTFHRNGLNILATITRGLEPAVKQMARLYVGGYEYGRYVEALNLMFVSIIVIIGLYYMFKKLLPIKLTIFVLTFWFCDLAFYILSGQALQNQTSRYLIMTIPIFVILLTGILSINNKLRIKLVISTIIIILINSLTLVSALTSNWNPSFTKDSHISSVISFMTTNKYPYAYASMDDALPADYYSNSQVKILPLSCNNGTLAPSYLFFDKGYYKATSDLKTATVPLILDGNQIANTPSVCSLASIKSEIGQWQSVKYLSDGSMVLIFNHDQTKSFR
jgi:hypothetical protein